MSTEDYIKKYFRENTTASQRFAWHLNMGENLAKGSYSISFYKYSYNMRIQIYYLEQNNQWKVSYDLYNNTDSSIRSKRCNTMLDAIDYAISEYMYMTGLENLSGERLFQALRNKEDVSVVTKTLEGVKT